MVSGAGPGDAVMPQGLDPAHLKGCCAAAYDSEAATILLGGTFHPGGLALTGRLGEIVGLRRGARLLDVATGRGSSAMFLAGRFGCDVAAIDYGRGNIEAASAQARAKFPGGTVTFQCADAEALPFADASFDAVICECAFCTFPDKRAAAGEFNRVLRPGGRVGLSDLTREGRLSAELEGLASWIVCIADAQPLDAYAALLANAAFAGIVTERHDGALDAFVHAVRTRLLATEVMVGLGKLVLPGFDFEAARTLARQALAAVRQGSLGYAIIAASKAR